MLLVVAAIDSVFTISQALFQELYIHYSTFFTKNL